MAERRLRFETIQGVTVHTTPAPKAERPTFGQPAQRPQPVDMFGAADLALWSGTPRTVTDRGYAPAPAPKAPDAPRLPGTPPGSPERTADVRGQERPYQTPNTQRAAAMPPRVIECPTCHHAAYMTLAANPKGYTYTCSNPEHGKGA